MTGLTRSLRPAAVLAAVLTGLVAGCASGTSSLSLSAAGSSPSRPASAVPVSGPATATTAPSGPGAPSGQVVYLAEGGSVGGALLHAPACKAGCQLSGDGTTSMWDMTWPTWNSTAAVGRGTEKLDDCTPDCASGTLHAVPVTVTLSKPVLVCVSGRGTRYWTSASFTWPKGLPAAFSGDNAPVNPFDYPGITAQSVKTCA
jgi:hypothetical protein